MRQAPVNTTHYLLQYTDEFLSRLTKVCREINDWDEVLERFEIPFRDFAIPTERFMSCGHCGHHESIRLNLASPRYPKWACDSLCHNSLQNNIVSLLCLFTDKSPLEVLQLLENKYIPDVIVVENVALQRQLKLNLLAQKKRRTRFIQKEKHRYRLEIIQILLTQFTKHIETSQ